MKRLVKLINIFIILIAITATFSYPAFSQEIIEETIEQKTALPISGVVESPSQFDGEKITLEGRVEKMRIWETATGKTYTIFKLVDGAKNKVAVYFKGKLDIKKGSQIKVYGKFRKERKYLFYKFKNVLKAKQVYIAS